MYGGDYKITTLRGAILSTIMKMQVIAPNATIVFVNFPNTRLVDGTGKNGTATHQPELQNPILDALEYVHKWGAFRTLMFLVVVVLTH